MGVNLHDCDVAKAHDDNTGAHGADFDLPWVIDLHTSTQLHFCLCN